MMPHYETERDNKIIGALEEIAKQLKRMNEPTYEIATATTYFAPRAEVAREIFAEIEKAHDECIWIDITTRIGYLQQTKFEHKLAELKKKYTEDGK